MRLARFCFVFFVCLTTTLAAAQSKEHRQLLQAIDLQQVPKWNAPYEFRIASFQQGEAAGGNGAVVLVLSHDQRKAFVNIQGVTTELNAVNKNLSQSCSAGEIRQNVYSDGRGRLLLKLKLQPIADACQADGLLSIHLDKRTHRYLIKGVLGL